MATHHTDVIFDIDGTLADASHRLHFIQQDPKDWDSFLSDEQVAKDAPIKHTWDILAGMVSMPNRYRVIFITGRAERTRQMTYDWLTDSACPIRWEVNNAWIRHTRYQGRHMGPILYMRKDGDRRKSELTKRTLLKAARSDGFNPQIVFEDRRADAAMWREEGLLCYHVAEGDY